MFADVYKIFRKHKGTWDLLLLLMIAPGADFPACAVGPVGLRTSSFGHLVANHGKSDMLRNTMDLYMRRRVLI